jgi:probable rRNA maturation factor
MALRADLSFCEPMTAAQLPMKPRAIAAHLARAAKLLAREPEWKESAELLGGQPTQLALVFCDDDEMRRLQRKHRKLDRTTDVLSFPTREVPGMQGAFAWLPKGERSLGDVVVSMPAVVRGARRGKRTPARELAEVLVHGLLHLVGCDHVKVSPARVRRMRALQKALLRSIAQP